MCKIRPILLIIPPLGGIAFCCLLNYIGGGERQIRCSIVNCNTSDIETSGSRSRPPCYIVATVTGPKYLFAQQCSGVGCKVRWCMKCAGHCVARRNVQCWSEQGRVWQVWSGSSGSATWGATAASSPPPASLPRLLAPRSCTLLWKIDSQTFLCAAYPYSFSSCLLHPQAGCCTNDELQLWWRGSPTDAAAFVAQQQQQSRQAEPRTLRLQLQERKGWPCSCSCSVLSELPAVEADAVSATTCVSRTLKLGFPLWSIILRENGKSTEAKGPEENSFFQLICVLMLCWIFAYSSIRGLDIL